VEVAEIEGREYQDEPEDARCGREGRGRGNFGAGLGHGKRSLALSVYLGRLEVGAGVGLVGCRGILLWGMGRKGGSFAPALKRGFANGK